MKKRACRTLWIILILLVTGPLESATAEPLESEKLTLKATVVRHIEAHTDNGTYLFVDQESTKLRRLKFVAMHPVVFGLPDGTFVLCADFEDADRNKVLIDYYVKKLGQSYRVLSSIEGRRSLLMRIGEKFGL